MGTDSKPKRKPNPKINRNSAKAESIEKHQYLIEILGLLGKGVMKYDHLMALCFHFDIYKNNKEFYAAIDELVRFKVIEISEWNDHRVVIGKNEVAKRYNISKINKSDKAFTQSFLLCDYLIRTEMFQEYTIENLIEHLNDKTTFNVPKPMPVPKKYLEKHPNYKPRLEQKILCCNDNPANWGRVVNKTELIQLVSMNAYIFDFLNHKELLDTIQYNIDARRSYNEWYSKQPFPWRQNNKCDYTVLRDSKQESIFKIKPKRRMEILIIDSAETIKSKSQIIAAVKKLQKIFKDGGEGLKFDLHVTFLTQEVGFEGYTYYGGNTNKDKIAETFICTPIVDINKPTEKKYDERGRRERKGATIEQLQKTVNRDIRKKNKIKADLNRKLKNIEDDEFIKVQGQQYIDAAKEEIILKKGEIEEKVIPAIDAKIENGRKALEQFEISQQKKREKDKKYYEKNKDKFKAKREAKKQQQQAVISN